MAAATTTSGTTATLVFANGNKSDGTPNYVRVNAGSINPATYTESAFRALVNGLAGIFSIEFQFAEVSVKSKMTW